MGQDDHARLHRVQKDAMRRLLPTYAQRMAELEASIHDGYSFPWRVAESPAVIPRPVFEGDVADLRRLLRPYFTDDFRGRYQTFAPERFRRPDDSGWFPRFIATDYQRVWDAERGGFKLCCPEIQSFPGNVMLKPTMLRSCLRDLSEFEEADCFLSDDVRSWEDYVGLLREHVLRDHTPADTVVLEVDPQHQKTLVDQLLIARHLGCRIVALDDITVDPATHEATYRRAIEFSGALPRTVEYETPVCARNILSRCLPDAIDEAVASPASPVTPASLEALLQGTLSHGTADWVVHPQDFFVLSKASLVGNPYHYPALRPLDAHLMEALESEGLDFDAGVIKPAFAAGGKGVTGLEAADVDRGAILERELARRNPDPMTMLLWQEKYGADAFPREDIPGYEPRSDVEADPVYHELRIMWAARPGHGSDVALTPLCGLTRWSRVGIPASASRQSTPFTGTQGIFVAD